MQNSFSLCPWVCWEIMVCRHSCNTTIMALPNHVQISYDQSLIASGESYWVCEGVNVTVTSSPGMNLFYLEKKSTLTFMGSGGDGIWAKDSCVVTNNSSDYISVTCNPSTVTLLNNGAGTINSISCANIVYDYYLVGGSPCIGTPGSIYDYSQIMPTSIYPNPIISSFVLFIVTNSLNEALTFVLYNTLGKEVKRVENISSMETTLSRGNLKSGIYSYQLMNKSIVVSVGKISID